MAMPVKKSAALCVETAFTREFWPFTREIHTFTREFCHFTREIRAFTREFHVVQKKLP
ncbi:hypothetical protein [Peribacillus frigoritolerans]|uniref:hypothetical protein n=1 Tax=Peribacillus frigoritolerans TaxID=450367 RepID=UPI001E40EB65|nr:hypothetical protein [Peribacillus frigoritolerans]